MISPSNHNLQSHGPTGARARRCVVAAALALGALAMPATVMAAQPDRPTAPAAAGDDLGPRPEVERARLIRRFERGSGSGGSGLGLAIAHQVAIAHGGGLEVGDSPAGGARVTITFAGTPAGVVA